MRDAPPATRFGIPTAVGAVLGWIIFRLVQYPPFVEFLIATEAEMNKVSWTSRDDLYRATSVVLTTVLLMAVFLFGVDWVWSTCSSSSVCCGSGAAAPSARRPVGRRPTSRRRAAAARHDETMPTGRPRWLMVETSGRDSATAMDFPEMCSKTFGLQTPPRGSA